MTRVASHNGNPSSTIEERPRVRRGTVRIGSSVPTGSAQPIGLASIRVLETVRTVRTRPAESPANGLASGAAHGAIQAGSGKRDRALSNWGLGERSPGPLRFSPTFPRPSTLREHHARVDSVRAERGPVRFAVDAKSQAARRPFDHKLVVRETGFSSSGMPEGAGIQELHAALAADQRRNDLIFDDVVRALEQKRSPILLTERRDHLEHFAERLQSFARHLVVLHGGMKPKERREVIARLAAIPAGEERMLIATGRCIGEGFDDARLDTLFLALPVSWKGTLIQCTPAYIAFTPARPRSGSTTTWTTRCRC